MMKQNMFVESWNIQHFSISNISDFNQTWLREDDNPLEFLGSKMQVEKISETIRIIYSIICDFNSIYRVSQKRCEIKVKSLEFFWEHPVLCCALLLPTSFMCPRDHRIILVLEPA